MTEAAAQHRLIHQLGSDRRPEAVAAALDQLAVEANDPESRAAFQRGAKAIRGLPAAIPARRGRKFITDDAALREMARHNLKRRQCGQPDNDREAARIVSRRLSGHSPFADTDRLRRKFRQQRTALMESVRWDIIDPAN
jgi:hypothetical protein